MTRQDRAMAVYAVLAGCVHWCWQCGLWTRHLRSNERVFYTTGWSAWAADKVIVSHCCAVCNTECPKQIAACDKFTDRLGGSVPTILDTVPHSDHEIRREPYNANALSQVSEVPSDSHLL